MGVCPSEGTFRRTTLDTLISCGGVCSGSCGPCGDVYVVVITLSTLLLSGDPGTVLAEMNSFLPVCASPHVAE